MRGSEAPHDKTLRFNGLIGDYSGLLRRNDMWADEHIKKFIGGAGLTPARAVEVIEEPIRTSLKALGPDWYGKLDIVFASKRDIARIEFRPADDEGDLERKGISVLVIPRTGWSLVRMVRKTRRCRS